MKVIKKGRPQKGWAKKFECTGAGNGMGGCHATLLVEWADLFFTYRPVFREEPDVFVTFKCVECGVLTDIGDTRINKERVPNLDKILDQEDWEIQKNGT